MEQGKLSIRACAFAASLIWGFAVLLVGVLNLLRPGYGVMFLHLISSVYPGYDAQPTLFSVVIGSLYALLDGAIGGLVFAALYNFAARVWKRKGSI